MSEDVVLLHGFGGTHRAWDGVVALLDRERYRPLALDLPGHGEASSATRPISFAGCVEHVLAAAPKRFALCGYSLGGRVALHVALAAPARVVRMVLVSTNPGIEDEAERAARRRSDHALADDLEHRPYREFIARWGAQPLFAADPPGVRALARADQQRNRPAALAAVLRGVGMGEMQPLWSRLAELPLPVAVVVGEQDEKYKVVGRRTVGVLARGELIVASGGHRLPLENPAAVCRALAEGCSQPVRV